MTYYSTVPGTCSMHSRIGTRELSTVFHKLNKTKTTVVVLATMDYMPEVSELTAAVVC